MGFLEAYKIYWKNYVNFTGKTSRKGYWFVILWNVLISTPIIFGVMIGALMSVNYVSNTTLNLTLALIIGMIIFVLATFIPNLSLNCRRFNDVGLSHWWYVGLYISSLGLTIVTEFINESTLLLFLVSIVNFAMLFIAILPSNNLSK